MIHAGTEIESDILDLLADEDGELDLGNSLTALLYVTAGLCCQATEQRPADLAIEFATKLFRLIEQEQSKPRLVS
ncbi:MAG: hypothetical protein M9955_17160 [Rhizobiaceae bacterium]|nr:hypothetical protein [Rhizobiaceae bacterium]